MKISDNITYAEAIHSNTAKRKGIDNTPNPTQVENMKITAEKIFQPLREWVGGPIKINSFFRSPEPPSSGRRDGGVGLFFVSVIVLVLERHLCKVDVLSKVGETFATLSHTVSKQNGRGHSSDDELSARRVAKEKV